MLRCAEMTSVTAHTRPAAQHSLDGASVLVTGATGGIGGALAVELDRRGAILTLVARRHDALERLPVPGFRHVADLRSARACTDAVLAAMTHAGRLDVVVNAVGVVAFGTVADLSVETMEALFLTNTFIPIMLARAALGHISRGGAIVNLSGVIAERNLPGLAAYGASKAALRAFDEALAREALRQGVRALDARPPHTNTGLAGRPIDGRAPRMAAGLAPESVATTICDALELGTADLPSSAFS